MPMPNEVYDPEGSKGPIWLEIRDSRDGKQWIAGFMPEPIAEVIHLHVMKVIEAGANIPDIGPCGVVYPEGEFSDDCPICNQPIMQHGKHEQGEKDV